MKAAICCRGLKRGSGPEQEEDGYPGGLVFGRFRLRVIRVRQFSGRAETLAFVNFGKRKKESRKMFIRLVQATSGYLPDADANQKELGVKLIFDPEEGGSLRRYQMQGLGFTFSGKYKITDNQGNRNYGIGMMKSDNQLKFWGYKAGEPEPSIYFVTLKTGLTDGAYNKADDEVEEEVVLYDAHLNVSGEKITRLNNSKGYSSGWVKLPSYAGPFGAGRIYWKVGR
jgi:hypothetical protein